MSNFNTNNPAPTSTIQDLSSRIREKLFMSDGTDNNLADGNYSAKIVAVGFNTRPDKYNEGSERDVMTVTFEIHTSEKTVRLYYEVTVSLNPKSKMYVLLSTLNKLPAPNTHFNHDTLIGVNVVVRVKNNVANERTYLNIVDVFPLIQVPQASTATTAMPSNRTTINTNPNTSATLTPKFAQQTREPKKIVKSAPAHDITDDLDDIYADISDDDLTDDDDMDIDDEDDEDIPF